MARLLKGDEGLDLFCRYALKRIENNANLMMCCVGSTGSGKSYSQLAMAKLIDPSFNIDRVAFSPKEFMGIVTNGLQGGQAVVFDEFGVSNNARNWQSLTNKLLNFYMQTCRSQNNFLFFNAPDFSFIDASSRKLFHSLLETAGINRENQTVGIKAKFLQVNKTTGKVYAKYLRCRVHSGWGGVRRIKMIHVPKPDAELLVQYEAKKKLFQKELYTDIMQQLDGKKKDKALTPHQQRFTELYNSGLSIKEIAAAEGYTERAAYGYRASILNKGGELLRKGEQYDSKQE